MYKYIEQIKNGLITFKQYFCRRYFRIFPLLLITTIVYEILLITYNKNLGECFYGQTPNLIESILTVTGVQTWANYRSLAVNNPTWYLSVLILCYIVFYLCVFISKFTKIDEKVFFIMIVFVGVIGSVYNLDFPFINAWTCRGYYAFFFGVLLSEFSVRLKVNRIAVLICIAIVVGIPVSITLNKRIMFNNVNYLMAFIYYPSLIMVFKNSKLNKLFNNRMFREWSMITFDTYVWHLCTFMIIEIVLNMMHIDASILNSRGMMTLVTIACFIVGALSYYLIEKPINNIINKKTTNK